MSSEDRIPQIPVSVITGFLGSGKTTLLSKLLSDSRMNKAAVIINEFGEVGLDHLLVTAPREDVLLLSSGCLCCSLRGDLVNTLTGLWNERARGELPGFDRVLVETTGLADPAPVLLTLTADERLSEVFYVERVIATIDAVHGLGQFDMHPESVKQACVADVLLVTKTDLVEPEKIQLLRARLNRLNPIAVIHEVVQGEINPDLLFDLIIPNAPRLRDFSDLVDKVEKSNEHHSGHHHHGGHSHDGIQSFSVIHDGPVTFSGLELWMGMLGEVRGPDLLRVKGIVNVGGRPIVIQAVQHMFHPLSELPAWPENDPRSRIVFITRNIPREQIERTLGALSLETGPSTRSINAEAFSRFVAAAAKFR